MTHPEKLDVTFDSQVKIVDIVPKRKAQGLTGIIFQYYLVVYHTDNFTTQEITELFEAKNFGIAFRSSRPRGNRNSLRRTSFHLTKLEENSEIPVSMIELEEGRFDKTKKQFLDQLASKKVKSVQSGMRRPIKRHSGRRRRRVERGPNNPFQRPTSRKGKR